MIEDAQERVRITRFNDIALYGHSDGAFYKFDETAVIEFDSNLLKVAKEGAQRNATELGAELAAAMSANDAALRGTELFARLDDLKTALKDWDTLLASHALPDKNAVRDKATNCARKLESCYQVHGKLVTSRQTTNPFVKYQLLATMRALGEKVASQFAARAGKASFTAMCELIADVPNRGSKGTERAKELNLSGNLGNAWAKELAQVGRDLAPVDKNLAEELKMKFLETSYGVGDALNSWRENYKDPGKLTSNLGPLREAIAKIAFGLGKYKSIADSVLGKSDSREVQSIRDRYQQTFDGFASQLQHEIELCVKTLRS